VRIQQQRQAFICSKVVDRVEDDFSEGLETEEEGEGAEGGAPVPGRPNMFCCGLRCPGPCAMCAMHICRKERRGGKSRSGRDRRMVWVLILFSYYICVF
jgi:hypothetical protein